MDIGIAQGRVAKRGRCEESSIPSEYQRKLHKKHRDWFVRMEEEQKHQRQQPTPLAGADKASALDVTDDDAIKASADDDDDDDEQRVLQLDASRDNDKHTVDEWLAKIELFLDVLTRRRRRQQQIEKV